MSIIGRSTAAVAGFGTSAQASANTRRVAKSMSILLLEAHLDKKEQEFSCVRV
jgi:hypothetical protein